MMILKTASLPDFVIAVVNEKGTEQLFTGEYDDFCEPGTYLCRQCGHALFRSSAKFNASCGWPSFDEEIKHAVLREPDSDGRRIEILCARCRAHLGHVFEGENFTPKNARHCVNSLSLDFVSDLNIEETEEAIFAAGCFWGVESLFQQLSGVIKTEVGYTGGQKKHPTYEEVCRGQTGHYEAIRVIYDPLKINYEALTKYFFEIHNPTQINSQGPDHGEQYQSAIFYYNAEQLALAQQLVQKLEKMKYAVTTKILPMSVFWRAETYHQNYYAKSGKHPYCHVYEKKFPV
ncbi:MAG: peptide-methionine (S)-S-oxide reductase [Gammaproteobacteria bacterium RIFCSPHIGHO2_12_FULL_42_10]|nr:MAG: peptide-methionine (S)-S-oxide reductase [Gammaproteobacteria bacterium RIFCSPHIGHO2_12_FULL_42_10]